MKKVNSATKRIFLYSITPWGFALIKLSPTTNYVYRAADNSATNIL